MDDLEKFLRGVLLVIASVVCLAFALGVASVYFFRWVF